MSDPATLPARVQESIAVPPSRQRTAVPSEELFDRALRTLEAAEAAIQEEARDSQSVPQSRKRKLAVSVVIPVYNERETIREVVDHARKLGLHEEIVIVDDCSTDGTRDVLIELGQLPGVQVFMHGYKRGTGAVLRTAMENLRGDVVVLQNAGLRMDPADYERLLVPIELGEADVVFGSRQNPSRVQHFGNRLLTRLSNLTTGLVRSDMETCYKAFRRDVLRGMTFREQGSGFEPEFTAKIARSGCVVREVPVQTHAVNRTIGLRGSLSTLRCILRYAWAD